MYSEMNTHFTNDNYTAHLKMVVHLYVRTHNVSSSHKWWITYHKIQYKNSVSLCQFWGQLQLIKKDGYSAAEMEVVLIIAC